MIWIALAYHLASRLAYVLYVGLTLKRQDRTEYLTRRYGVEPGFQRFRRVAAFVMANDAVSLAVLCLVSADTLRVGLPRGLAIARSEEHTSELQSRLHLVCRLLLEKKKRI